MNTMVENVHQTCSQRKVLQKNENQLGFHVFCGVSVPTGHITGQYQEGSGRGQKRAGLDLAQKWPSCVRLSIRNESLLKGGARRGSEEGPRERPGKASTNRSKTKSERRTLSERMMTKSV